MGSAPAQVWPAQGSSCVGCTAPDGCPAGELRSGRTEMTAYNHKVRGRVNGWEYHVVLHALGFDRPASGEGRRDTTARGDGHGAYGCIRRCALRIVGCGSRLMPRACVRVEIRERARFRRARFHARFAPLHRGRADERQRTLREKCRECNERQKRDQGAGASNHMKAYFTQHTTSRQPAFYLSLVGQLPTSGARLQLGAPE